MSRGQIPRIPAYFPRMKYRARKRHEREMFEAGWIVVTVPMLGKWLIPARAMFDVPDGVVRTRFAGMPSVLAELDKEP